MALLFCYIIVFILSQNLKVRKSSPNLNQINSLGLDSTTLQYHKVKLVSNLEYLFEKCINQKLIGLFFVNSYIYS